MHMVWNPENNAAYLVHKREKVKLAAKGWLTKQPYNFDLTKENENDLSNDGKTEENQKSYEKNSTYGEQKGSDGYENKLRDERQVPYDRKRKAK